MEEPRPRMSHMWILFAILATMVLYPLSFGPACWIVSRMGSGGEGWIGTIYAPVLWAWRQSPDPVQTRVTDFANLGRGIRKIEITNWGITIWEEGTLSLKISGGLAVED